MDISKLTLLQLAEKLKSRECSAEELCECHIQNIESTGEKIGAYLTLTFENARAAAKEMDEKRAKGERLSLLAGIPCAVKDNICTKGIQTTCASRMLEHFVPPYDAHVIKRLHKQGAVLLGKLNMDEFAMGSTTENSYFKTTKNPRNTAYVPGGSSGGSAAAVAANQAVYTLGSDTGGSIRQPAAFCGVVGMKPTYGTVSRNGLIAFASSFDQIGPITKDVQDNAAVLGAISGYDPKDSTSVKRPAQDYIAALEADVKGMKIALPKEYFGEGIAEEVRTAVLSAAKVYEKLGVQVCEVSLPSLEMALPAYYVISSAEASSNLARFDGIRFGYRSKNHTNIEELYKQSRSEGFGEEVKRRILLGTFALSAGYNDAYYKKALQVRTLLMQDFAKVFSEFDCILSPVAPSAAYKIGEKIKNSLEMYHGDICTVPVNIAGLPSLALPFGQNGFGLPLSVQLIGRHFGEGTLYRLGYALERQAGAYPIRQETGGQPA